MFLANRPVPAILPAGQASTGLSTPTKVVMTAFVLGGFWFAVSTYKQAEEESSKKLAASKASYARHLARQARANPTKKPSPAVEARLVDSMFRRNSDVAGWKLAGSHGPMTAFRSGNQVRWTVEQNGKIIGSGAAVLRGDALETSQAVVLAPRKGVYSEVLRGLSKIFGVEVVSDVSLTKGAIGAWKKTGAKLEYWQGDRRYVLKPRT